MIKTPFNYTGGKYKLLPQLLPLFPKDIETFVDAFTGGGSVCANVPARKTCAIDSSRQVIEMHQCIQRSLISIDSINKVIEQYNLTATNKESYLKLREDYNKNPDPIRLFTLLCHSFNNDIRFNSKGCFNVPFGKRTFNESMQTNLQAYSEVLKKKNIVFMTGSAFAFAYYMLSSNDFVYLDPPYLITDADYNASWGINEEKRLLELLDNLNKGGIKWGLSNVLVHKGKRNDLLTEWSKDKNVYHLSHSYKNCHYRTKKGDSDEVFICNY